MFNNAKTCINGGIMPDRSRKRRRKRHKSDLMVLELLVLVVLVIIIFEGRLIHTMLSQRNSSSVEVTDLSSESTTENEDSSSSSGASGGSSNVLAGFDPGTASGISAADTQTESKTQTESETNTESEKNEVSEVVDSTAVVPQQSVSVDDSYFNDAVFIGDSRMEGFRNTSGITQGTFLTSVGMSIDTFSSTTFTTDYGQVTAYQALSGTQYAKVYIMLGANDLGYNPWSQFLSDVEGVLKQIHKLQTRAIIYVCCCIYLEPGNLAEGYDPSYINNDNVRLINGYLLQACEDLDYCHYLNLNEVLSDGYGELPSGATADGVHMYENYNKIMLDYLKSHYITIDKSK